MGVTPERAAGPEALADPELSAVLEGDAGGVCSPLVESLVAALLAAELGASDEAVAVSAAELLAAAGCVVSDATVVAA